MSGLLQYRQKSDGVVERTKGSEFFLKTSGTFSYDFDVYLFLFIFL